jgi:hypothetical protein
MGTSFEHDDIIIKEEATIAGCQFICWGTGLGKQK